MNDDGSGGGELRDVHHLHRWHHPIWGRPWFYFVWEQNISCWAESAPWISPSSWRFPRSQRKWPAMNRGSGEVMQTEQFCFSKIKNAMLMFSRHLFNELFAERTTGPKALLLQCHVLLGLRVKGGILNKAVHKQPDVVLHLEKKQWTLSGAFPENIFQGIFYTHIVNNNYEKLWCA